MSVPAAVMVSVPPLDVCVPPVIPMFASASVVVVAGIHWKPVGDSPAVALSKTAVVVVLVVCELAPRPTSAAGLNVPQVYRSLTWFQVAPSGEVQPMNVRPDRTMRTQMGTALPVWLPTVVAAPPVGRSWKVAPEGVIPTNAFTASGDDPSRMSRPALQYGSVLPWLRTFVTAKPSPV